MKHSYFLALLGASLLTLFSCQKTDLSSEDSAASLTKNATTAYCPPPPEDEGCTLTQGYWKNHPDAWPVTSLTLGTITYTQAQLLEIFKTPVRGNGLIILAHQLIAAKLNIAAGASDDAVDDAIDDADALVGDQVIPPIGSGYARPQTTSSLANTLDSYNSGIIGPGSCT
jgi:hypothetical protein